MGARSSKNTTQNNRSDGHLLEYFRNTFVRGGGANSGPNIPPFTATGGNISALAPGNGYRYHTFTSTGTFTVSGNPGIIEVLLVGGGGGAGAPLGSGGGAGGLVYHTAFPITIGSYPVVVGGSGAGSPGGTPATNATGSKGGPSTFGGMTADGGGGGSPYYTDSITGPNQVSGGSGGGFSNPAPGSATQPGLNSPFTPNPNFVQYGNNGSQAGDPIGGAGGGAGAAGSPTGAGGAGRQYPGFTGPLIGVPTLAPLSGFFAGGGAAGSRAQALSGGSGGGGPNPGNTISGTAGTQNSGGGAGGGTYISSGLPGAVAGGSGIVIIRYLPQ